MDVFDNCRICLNEISYEPIKMTRFLIKFLEKSLRLTNVTKGNHQNTVKQNLCAPCFNKLSEFQDFFEQCKDSDEFWKAKFDDFKQTNLPKQLAFEQPVILPIAANCCTLGTDAAAFQTESIQEAHQEHNDQQTIKPNQNIGTDQEQREHQIRQTIVIPIPLINGENETGQVHNLNSIELTNWVDETNDSDTGERILGKSGDDAEVNTEIIEYEYKIEEDEVEIEEIPIVDEAGSSESFGVDYRSICNENFEAEHYNDETIVHEIIEDVSEEQSSAIQNTFVMTTAIDENGKIKMSYKCQYCDRSFNRIYDIESHYNIHNGVKPYKCNVCGKSFRQKNILTTHQTLHFGKKVECAECGKKFARRSQLILHYRMHRGEKPFVCDFEGCHAAFRQRKQLVDHSFIHTGEKNFQCTTCTKSFHTRKRLQDHIYKVHSQHRYRCNLCEKAFLKPHMLKHHMVSAHNIEVDDVSHLKTVVNDLKSNSRKSTKKIN